MIYVDCYECAYWIKEEDTPEYGSCRRNAPKPVVQTTGPLVKPELFATVWPYTRDRDGCFVGKKAAPKEEPRQVIPDQNDTPSQAMTRPESAFNKAINQAMEKKKTSFNDQVEDSK